MRIAIINWSSRRVGGIEVYLNAAISELARAGHEIAFLCEVGGPTDREPIDLPDGSPVWCVAELGQEVALRSVCEWRPDVSYCHKLADASLESRIIELAPSVFFAHDYGGTCISGTKTFNFPEVQSCNRVFGWKCLVHYFPHRCGGLNPITMVNLYNEQSKRLENMRAYDAIVTHSDHMLAELSRHGLTAQRAYKNNGGAQRIVGNGKGLGVHGAEKKEVTLLFSGRLEHLKGARLLIDALPMVQRELKAQVRLIIAGDGRERGSLERRAARIGRAELHVDFLGWLERNELEKLLTDCDLLVVSSLWPEPFGLIGPEAGALGVPVAAFDVGGIRDWLSDGVNGFLAPGNPPTSDGLAEAIVKCLRDPKTHASLRAGAFELAQRFSMQNHLAALLEIFSNVTGRDFRASSERARKPAVPAIA